MTPLYIQSGPHAIAAIYQPAASAPAGTAALLVPPFGWDDQTSYRPRRDWSLALAECGFASLRIDLPGCGDSSGAPDDDGLVDCWTAAVASGVEWLRSAGARRVALIALGSGGLISLNAIAHGTRLEELVLWGVPPNGRALVREIRAFGRLEQAQTGEAAGTIPEGELRSGGHLLTPATIAGLSRLEPGELLRTGGPERALLLGRDGLGPEPLLADALRSSGAEVRTDPGYGWGAALERAQSSSPTAIFATVNSWLREKAAEAPTLAPPPSRGSAVIGARGQRVRETPVLFDARGQQLYAILAEPADRPAAHATVILFNAGAIRRIGPNRMWTEAARRWAAKGVPVIRVDLEGIGDSTGDASPYSKSDESFYTEALVEQARAALALAGQRGLPERFVLAGLCSGAFWAFHSALADPRVETVVALNPRMLIFDAHMEGRRDMRRLQRILRPAGLRNMLAQKRKLSRARRLLQSLPGLPLRRLRRAGEDPLSLALHILDSRGQRLHLAFSGEEPLLEELGKEPGLDRLHEMGVHVHALPCRSHTLKPFDAQSAAHAILDHAIAATLGLAGGDEEAVQSRKPDAAPGPNLAREFRARSA